MPAIYTTKNMIPIDPQYILIHEEARTIFNSLPDDGRTKEFLLEVLEDFVNSTIIKFVKGQKEHGNCILDREALPDIKDESIDLFVYYKLAEKNIAKLNKAAMEKIYQQDQRIKELESTNACYK